MILAFLLIALAGVGRAADTVTQDVKVVVLPFAINAGDDLSYLKDSLPELITDRLRESGFQVVDPAEVGRVIDEKASPPLHPRPLVKSPC